MRLTLPVFHCHSHVWRCETICVSCACVWPNSWGYLSVRIYLCLSYSICKLPHKHDLTRRIHFCQPLSHCCIYIHGITNNNWKNRRPLYNSVACLPASPFPEVHQGEIKKNVKQLYSSATFRNICSFLLFLPGHKWRCHAGWPNYRVSLSFFCVLCQINWLQNGFRPRVDVCASHLFAGSHVLIYIWMSVNSMLNSSAALGFTTQSRSQFVFRWQTEKKL